MTTKKTWNVLYWVFTGIFCVQMAFTAFAQLYFADVASEFTRLGFPSYFRVELCVLKLLGVAVILIPMVPVRLKEWAYSGFTIVLGSALIAHLVHGDGFEKWVWSVGTFVLAAMSYLAWRMTGRGGTLGSR